MHQHFTHHTTNECLLVCQLFDVIIRCKSVVRTSPRKALITNNAFQEAGGER